MTRARDISAVLFDLDGTLLDTAPDMVAALNTLLREQQRDVQPYDVLRQSVSHGARGLIDSGFGVDLDDDYREELTARFLEIYADALAVETAPFSGINTLLDAIDQAQMRWGIVTNKPGWLTTPLLQALEFGGNAACVISGDSLAQRKPHPAPLQHAAGLLKVRPEQCIYVGDAQRDIDAGRAAGMLTVVARYGYIRDEERPEEWRADISVDHPRELLGLLNGYGHG